MGKVFRALKKSGMDAPSEQQHSETPAPKEQEQAAQAGGAHDSFGHGSDITQVDGDFFGKWDERLMEVVGSSSQLSETFRVLRTRILHPLDGRKPPRTILVTSTAPGEGKSFTSANLAISLARGLDQYSLLIDCDMRRPTLAGLLGQTISPGLSDYLQSGQDLSMLIKKTSIEKLSLLASGLPPVNPSELLGSTLMYDLVEELSSRYEDRFIIFDSPPIQAASETAVLARQVDGVVVVVRWGGSTRDQVLKLVNNIGKDKILGVVFNGYKSNIVESKLFDYYGHYRAPYVRDSEK